MLKTIDVKVSRPERCPLRLCSVDAELVPEADLYCYCQIKVDGKYKSTPCSDGLKFPENCPLSNANINLWRDK